MRAVLVLTILLVASAAGCMGQSKPSATTSAPTTTDPYELPPGVDNILRGRVTGPDENPLGNATILIDSLRLNQSTQADGSYEFRNLEPHDYLLTAVMEGYKNRTQRAIVEDGRIFELHFQLEERPNLEPFNETTPFTGMISCEFAYATNPENVENVNCSPPGDPNNKQSHDFYVKPGAAQIQIQAGWSKTTDLSKKLAMTIESVGFGHQDIQFGHSHGEHGFKMVIGQTQTQKYYGNGGTVRVSMNTAPSVTGDEAALDVGLAVQQAFTIYFTVFYVEPGPPTYSAIPK